MLHSAYSSLHDRTNQNSKKFESYISICCQKIFFRKLQKIIKNGTDSQLAKYNFFNGGHFICYHGNGGGGWQKNAIYVLPSKTHSTE